MSGADFFDRQEASQRATRWLVVLFGLAFLAVGVVTGLVLLVFLGFTSNGSATLATTGDLGGMLLASLDVLLAIVAVVCGVMIVASLFRAATLFVYPSYYEGFGMPPLESMACGVAPVVANRSSLPEVVGDAGFLFDPDDTDDLFALLAELLDAPERAAAAGERGVERARAFTWPSAAQSLIVTRTSERSPCT